MADIRRIYASKTLTIPSGSSLSTESLDVRRMKNATLEMSAAWTAADVGFKVSSGSSAATAQLLYDDSGSLVEISSPSAGVAFNFPSGALDGVHYVWLFSQSGGTAVDQGAGRSLIVHLKS